MNLFVWKYFDFLLSIFTIICFYVIETIIKYDKISREVYKKNLIWSVTSPGGSVPKKFFKGEAASKGMGGFQRGVRPPKKLCKFNSIMPANAKDACKCRKQCHNEKYRATLQTKIFDGINAFCISDMTFSAFKEPSYNFNISFLLNFNNRETERCYYRRQKRNRKTPVLESF